ncbi:uncharacterized protein LOC107978944 isoform X5 [Cricetulus griseus]|uniref:Uncharacterized protein LOC107978944 isoform X5 n=1 Tax=Cricetulus griseus TaxID=10029 RepID=A0A9J7K5Y0_CRIGR|nr:uncharacterized protein LOC107978944 isoform X5 [Cricetulus griseus]
MSKKTLAAIAPWWSLVTLDLYPTGSTTPDEMRDLVFRMTCSSWPCQRWHAVCDQALGLATSSCSAAIRKLCVPAAGSGTSALLSFPNGRHHLGSRSCARDSFWYSVQSYEGLLIQVSPHRQSSESSILVKSD